MTSPGNEPVFDYPEEPKVIRPSQNLDKAELRGWVVPLIVTVVVALIMGAAYLIINHKNNTPVAASQFTDMCADTDSSASLRSKMVYTDPKYMGNIVKRSETEGDNWCVFGTTFSEDQWWAIVYVGEDNPLYRVMISENGDDDNATRAVITYQGVPPVKFAREGWIGFITGTDGEPWSVFRTGAGAILLQTIARDAAH